MAEEEQKNEYKPHLQVIEEAREEARNNAFKRKEVKKHTFNLTPEQIQWAEKTIHLKDSAGFKELMMFESLMISEALRWAFHVKPNVVKDQNGSDIKVSEKTFGEHMSYNEGFYHGLLKIQSERQRIWLTYLEYLKEKNKEKLDGQN